MSCNAHLAKKLSPLLALKQAATFAVPYGEGHMARNWGEPLTNSQQGTEALNPTDCQKLTAPKNWVSLEEDRSPNFSDENSALTNTLITAFQRTLNRDFWLLTFRHGEIINVCCFKSLCLQWHVTQLSPGICRELVPGLPMDTKIHDTHVPYRKWRRIHIQTRHILASTSNHP